MRAVVRLEEIARDFDIPLAAVALQFSTRDERITSTVVGVSSAARVEALVRNAELALPDEVCGRIDDAVASAPTGPSA